MTTNETVDKMVEVVYEGRTVSIPKSLAEKIADEELKQWEEKTDEDRKLFFDQTKESVNVRLNEDTKEILTGFTIYLSFDHRGIVESGIVKSEKFKVLQKVRRTKKELEREKKEAESKK